MKNTVKKINWKKASIASAVSLIPLSLIGTFALTWKVYKDSFGIRYDTDSNLDLYLNHNDMPDLAFEERKFQTNNDNELKAWLYHKQGTELKKENFKAMIVLSHGMGEGHLPYLPEIKALVESNYLVFSFDNTGCVSSDGNGVKGFPQGVIDLKNALDYIEMDSILSSMFIGLYGHSWGGYSVMNVLHEEQHQVKAVLERSGPVSSKAIFMSVAEKKIGSKALLFGPFVSLVEYIKFKKIAGYNAIDAINNTDIPILLMQGKKDSVVPIQISPVAKASSISNSKVKSRILEDEGHEFLRSRQALKYQKDLLQNLDKLKAEYGEIPLKKKQEIMKNFDKRRFNELDSETMNEVICFFDSIFYK